MSLPPPERSDLGLVMGGGGARAAYQVGFLSAVARRRPDLNIPYLTGVSAGAINAAHLAGHDGSFGDAVAELAGLWSELTIEDVFRVDLPTLTWNLVRWAAQLVSGGGSPVRTRGLVDTQPLRAYLTRALKAENGAIHGIARSLDEGRLRAIALSTSSYTTGQSVTWVQGSDITEWQRPLRTSRKDELTVEHVMASAALPIFFPAVELDGAWYGDGGMRLAAPLSPALHLGASRVLAISTRYGKTAAEEADPQVRGYPPPAQIVGVLMNSIFLDLLDHDALRLERLNTLLEKLPEGEREGLRPVRLLVTRPSRDLGRMARDYEPQLPRVFRFLTRSLGTRETRSPDFLSLVLFQHDYLNALMEIGAEDAENRMDDILAFLDDEADDAP